MKEFKYEGMARFGVIFFQAGGVVSIILFTAFASAVSIMAIRADPPYWEANCLSLWTLIIGWMVGIGMINAFPTIWVEDQGLTISAFFFARVKVPWDEIIDMRASSVPFGDVVVRARRITPFHRICGWAYGRTLSPSFLVGRDIRDRDELLHEISNRPKAGRSR